MALVGAEALNKLLDLIAAKFNSLSTVATTGSYNDLSDKPTIPSVGNGRITIKQAGIAKGTFTVNQTGATTIELTDKDTTYTSLPNPNGLRVQVNGDGASEIRYDGSEAKTINFVAGNNVTLTQKTSENKVTIAAKDTTYSTGTEDTAGITKLYSGLGSNSDGTMTQLAIGDALAGKAGSLHTHDAATSSKAGFLSKDDKTKLDGIATGATKVALANMAGSGNKVGDISINGTTTTMYSPVQSSVSGNAGTATKWKTARNINGMSVQGDADRVSYGVCSTAATTAAKTVDCAGFTLITGAEITVKFTNTNSAAQPTLNVNNQGAKAIYYRGDIIPPTYLAKGRVYTFRYDGKNYELVGDINTDTNTDTKNTAGSTDTSSKIFLIGAKSQSANPQTYSHDTAYVGTDGCLYSGGTKVSVDGHTHGVATTSSSGFLSSTDKSKLDGIAAGAQVNQKAFSQFKVGTTEIKADTETDILTLVAGSNVTLTPDATNDRITIAAKDTTYSTGTETKAGITKLYSNIGTSTDGTMTQLAIGDALAGKAGTLHTHTKSQITDFPTSLKNPNGLRVQVNGDGASEVRYDGSAAKTINIKAGSNITITSDSSGNITISSTASAGSLTGDVGTVVYEASSGGLYCDGSTANTKANSKTIEDASFKYKRLRFYCQGYYGLVCVDMPLDREHPTYATGGETGKHYGGVIFPTAENSNIDSTGIGASSHMYYELKWRVTKESAGWRVRVVDSGWLGFNAGITSNANYTGNSSAAVAGTNYISWNQRHNNGYCIYKIVAYTD